MDACTPAWALWLPVVQSALLLVAAGIIAASLIFNMRLSRRLIVTYRRALSAASRSRSRSGSATKSQSAAAEAERALAQRLAARDQPGGGVMP